ncbi:MAG: phosphate/phosphite/phosphonate ABC transporter substrate-binding protein [Deltaproteobacteria bacterium]|nr:phosphate/phosphite/phosphonate ABC transporter substrate-binding protein [Deltaproteobacteria bacterium]
MKPFILTVKSINFFVCLTLLCCLTLGSIVKVSPVRAQEPLLFGVHPFLPFKSIEKKFTPLVDYLSRKLGRPVVLRVGSSYQEHIDAIGRDQLDIAYIGPAEYVAMVAKHGRKPLLACQETNGSPFFRGVIVARSELEAKTLAELPLGEFAFVVTNSTMGYLVPRIMLLQENPKFITGYYYQFLKTHENVALGVLSGDFIAGAVKEVVYQKFKERGLKALALTPPIAEHVLVSRSTLDQKLITALRADLLALKGSPAGKAVLTSIKPSLTGFCPVKDEDYDSLRKLLAESEPEAGGGGR